MSKVDDLRAMREANMAEEAQRLRNLFARKRGRPPIKGKPMTQKERQKRYRDRGNESKA